MNLCKNITSLFSIAAFSILATSPAIAKTADEIAVSTTLDNLHQAASEANGKKYFALFTDNAVFLGTDAEERWPIADFKTYAQKRFDTGTGWTYTKVARNITLHGDTAWFDENLKNKYGITRGTGVLVKQKGQWKILQYNLTMPIPNDMLERVAGEIQAQKNKPTQNF
ncbi:MAG: nuclear transport factor 2 family protein [Glaciimonas sp.]|nr:nuclear transport factor 2 family protein [Glaciimonas sp.]